MIMRESRRVGDNESLDTGLAGRTELRVHGVSGTPPETVLAHPLLKRVAGDDKAGFYRRWYPGGCSPDLDAERPSGRRLEAYNWGHLTSGSAARAAWLMLLPFMLVNLAHWMLPPVATHARPWRTRAGRASAVLLRLFGLVLTLSLALTAAQAAMDLVGWQCAGQWRCATDSALTALLADGWLAAPGRRLVVSALVPFAVIAIIALLGRRPLRRTEPEPDISVPSADDDPMARASFWRGNPGMAALRSAHVAATTALLAAAVAWPATTLAADGATYGIGLGICLSALAILGLTAVLIATERVAGRSGHPNPAVTLARRAAILLLAAAAGYALWDHGSWEQATALPGVRAAVLLTFGTGLVLLVLLTGTVAAQRPWRHGAGGFRVSMRGFGAPAVAVVAFLVAGGFSAGLTYRVADMLGYPVLSPTTAATERRLIEQTIGDESQPFVARQAAWEADIPMVLPPSYAWAGAAASVIVAAVMVIVAIVAVGVWRRIGPLSAKLSNEYGGSDEPDHADESAHADDYGEPGWATEPGSADRTRPAGDTAATPATAPGASGSQSAALRRVATVIALASLTDRAGRIVGRIVVVAGLVLLAGLGVYAAGFDDTPLVEDPPLSTLTAAGTWLMGAFAIGLVSLVWATARHPALRRTVGILWDIGSFWPRAAHPLAPPSYGERAVPDLTERTAVLTAAPNSRVILSGHSQGSVIVAATMRQLPPHVSAKVDLVTHGSPLRRLYARNFPAYFGHASLAGVAESAGSWLNLYRDTDPIGSWIFTPDDAGQHPSGRKHVDHRLLDPPTLAEPIAGHSDYWADPRYADQLDRLT